MYQCKNCGYVYDEREGCPWFGIPPKPFKELRGFKCPICGGTDFEEI